MEVIECFFYSIFKVLFVIFAIGTFSSAAYLYEENKGLRKELLECAIELRVIKEL